LHSAEDVVVSTEGILPDMVLVWVMEAGVTEVIAGMEMAMEGMEDTGIEATEDIATMDTADMVAMVADTEGTEANTEVTAANTEVTTTGRITLNHRIPNHPIANPTLRSQATYNRRVA